MEDTKVQALSLDENHITVVQLLCKRLSDLVVALQSTKATAVDIRILIDAVKSQKSRDKKSSFINLMNCGKLKLRDCNLEHREGRRVCSFYCREEGCI